MRVLQIVFLTLFIDLVGFSIIFPLFPSMLVHYEEVESSRGLIYVIMSAVRWLDALAGRGDAYGTIVLFGGILGSVYSLLQFVCAPVIGRLSDRYGRRPILLISTIGTAISYLIWIFAGHFELLVLSRVIGGIMSGNISTASAVVADVTHDRDRSKGMAIIGIAFGLGFIIGPAIGGIAAKLDLHALWPPLAPYGINPFSTPALVAFLLTVANVSLIAFAFPETLPPDAARRSTRMRTANPVALFHTESYPGVTRTNVTYFIFLTAFSGMEFSLNFLAAERFGFDTVHLAMMMIFIGVILALVQGGYVHRRSQAIGPKRMALHGLFVAIPSLVIVGFAPTVPILYVGLFLMAVGSAQIMPCLTALVSLYAPEHDQGRILGIFRSLGALARAVGPLATCVLYWRLGSATCYYLVAATLLVPVWLALKLPKPQPAPVRSAI